MQGQNQNDIDVDMLVNHKKKKKRKTKKKQQIKFAREYFFTLLDFYVRMRQAYLSWEFKPHDKTEQLYISHRSFRCPCIPQQKSSTKN